MHGEEKGINKASKATHLAKGGFWRWFGGWGWAWGWVWGPVEFQTFGAAGKPVQSYQRDSPHHTRELERLSRITETPARIRQTWLE